MKILIVTTDFYPNVSGIATLSLEQARGLSALGHEVEVLTTTDTSQIDTSQFSFKLNQVRVLNRPVLRLGSLYRAVSKAIRWSNPDYVYCTNYRGFGLPVALATRWSKIPFGIYFHGTELITESRTSIRRKILKFVAGSASLVCTNSINTQRLLNELYGITGQALTPGVTPLTISDKNPLASKAEALRAHWIRTIDPICDHEDAFVFVAACRLSRQKGLYTILKSLKMLPESVRNRALFVGIGSGPALSALKQIVVKQELTRNVLFPGPVDCAIIPAALKAADCYLQPSEPEGDFLESFGISFLEAQAEGLPCIGTDWGGVPEAVIKDTTALLVEPGCTRKVANAMVTVMTDSEWRENAATAGIDWASQNSWETHVKRLDALFVGSQ